MKTCSKCNRNLPLAEFNWKIKNVRRSVYCKSCSREYIRGHYDNNKRYYLDKARRRNKKIKNDNRVYIANYLKSHPCVDCGEKDILVLEFDHKNRTEKRYNISKMLIANNSLSVTNAVIELSEGITKENALNKIIRNKLHL